MAFDRCSIKDYLLSYLLRQNIQTRNTTKQTNEQIEKRTNGSDISHNMSSL